MKILIVIDSLGSGGAERSTAVTCDFLYENNIEFEVLCLDKKDVGVQNRMIDKGYAIKFVPQGGFIKQTNYIANFIKKGNYDLVHSILFRSNLRTRFAKLKVKFIHLESLVNTTYSSERLKDSRVNQRTLAIYKKIDQYSARLFVDYFHSITETVKQHYIDEINLIESRITVIPRGRKPISPTIKEKKDSEKSQFQLINVGRQEFQKGQMYLLKAVLVLKEEGVNFHLRILGRDGNASKEIKEFIINNNLEDHVSLEGFKSNVADYLLQSDIFVFPSLYEGLGGALIEAQAAGLPIACNNIPVLHEVVVAGRNAVFFDVHKTDTIVEAIKFYVQNPEERYKHGEFSIKNFNENFLESENNKRMLNLYKQVCLNSGS